MKSSPSRRAARSLAATAVALAGTCLLAVTGTRVVGSEAAGAATHSGSETGFTIPFSGAPRL